MTIHMYGRAESGNVNFPTKMNTNSYLGHSKKKPANGMLLVEGSVNWNLRPAGSMQIHVSLCVSFTT